MDPKPDLIREDIDETRSDLTQNLAALEAQLRGTVETARRSVDEAVQAVRGSLRQVSPRYQTRQHPFAMVGGAVAVGVLAGVGWRRARQRAVRPPRETAARATPALARGIAEPQMPSRFGEELGVLKRALMAAAVSAAGSWVKSKVPPHWSEPIDHALETAGEKLSAHPSPSGRPETARNS
jgi:hypothetical protein